MTREEAIPYVSFQMDDAHDRRNAKPRDVGSKDRLVGFRESDGVVVFVAVRSHLAEVILNDETAKERGIARGGLHFLK